jgi:hypothetical protein
MELVAGTKKKNSKKLLEQVMVVERFYGPTTVYSSWKNQWAMF